MNIAKAFGIVALSAVSWAIIGVTVGWYIGTFAPDTYRLIFASQQVQDFDPVEVGLGLGLAQGIIGGAVLGVLVVAIVAWYNVRMATKDDGQT